MLRIPWWIVLATVASVPAACTQPEAPAASAVEQSVSHVAAPAPRAAEPQRVTASDAASAIPRIVMLGDSLTAGYGLDKPQSFPALLQQRLNEAGYRYEVVNAGVSGDTSAGGLSRLDWALDGDVRFLIVALGGNDALRALSAANLRQNLSTIIERAQAKHITVVLVGMEAPRNFGRDYIVRFHQVYPDLAHKYNVALVPFLLQDVAGIDRLNQRDGIHPTPEGADIVARNIWSVLKALLAAARS